MDWSKEERAKLEAANDRGCGWPQIAELAVKLYRARLTPSGQVAEDVERLRRALNFFGDEFSGILSLSLARLAAGAHAREQAERRAAKAETELQDMDAAVADGHRALAERDAANRERDEAKYHVSAIHGAAGCPAMHTALVAESGCARDNIIACQKEAESLRAQIAGVAEALGWTPARCTPERVREQVKAWEAERAGHAAAIVRARNEGLEKAAAKARSAAEHDCNPYASCTCDWEAKIDSIADDIITMKEPES